MSSGLRPPLNPRTGLRLRNPLTGIYLDPGDRLTGPYRPARPCMVLNRGKGPGPRNARVRYYDDGTFAIIPPLRRLRLTIHRYPCADCLAPTIDEHYMVSDSVWATAGMPPGPFAWLCVGCLEKRLGRMLCRADFTPAPVNRDGWHQRRSERLADRLASDAPRPLRG